MSTVDTDFKEWSDGFNDENIPDTIINKSWHLDFQPTQPISLNQNCFKVDYPIKLKFFLLAGRDVPSGIDSANSLGESIYKECLKHSNRLGITGANDARIININPGSMTIQAVNNDNDNTIRVEIDFICQIIMDLT